jgi:hypothetical protein
MMFGFVDMVYDEDIDSPELRALRTADRATIAQDLGFASWLELGAWAKARKQARAAK